MSTGLGIGWAVAQLKAGSRVRRGEWPADRFLEMGTHRDGVTPMIFTQSARHDGQTSMTFTDGTSFRGYYQFDSWDVLATDWEIA